MQRLPESISPPKPTTPMAGTTTCWQAEIDRAIDDRFEQMVEVRRHLHMHPELSGEEHQTSLYLYQLLDDEGVTVQLGPEGRGVIADAMLGEQAARIALRADIDALRIRDQKQVEYRSQRDGVLHGCGHDAHTATLLGAILAIHELGSAGKLPWPVNWRGIFQPAEETCTGAKEMIEAGALQGVKAILATHVDPTRRLGTIGLRSGVLTANCDAMELTVIGQGGHAARPHELIDPIAAAAQLLSSLYMFVPRATDSLDAVVVSIGQIIAGDNPNVIPEQVQLYGTLRTLDQDVRVRTMRHIEQLARGMAETSGTRMQVRFHQSSPSVVNDVELTALLRQTAGDVLGPDHVEDIPRPSMGGEDFAYYLAHVPGAMFRLGCTSDQVGGSLLHTPTFDIDERALAIGAKILARAAVQWSDPNRVLPA